MIVVTTPTGQIGRQVLDNILGGGEGGGEPVRVVARDPDRLPAHVRDRVEVVRGSHGDPDVVGKAFAGADAIFWLVPGDPRAVSLAAAYLDFTRPACAAFTNQRVVGVSALGRGVPGNAGYVSASLAMDDLIAGTGVSYRALTMPSFMDNLLWQAESIGQRGVFFGAVSGDRGMPMCATRDIATVAARLLLDPSWSGVAEVPVLGPEDLSHNDVAEIMSEVLGRPVRYQRVSFDAFYTTQLEHGRSPAMAKGMVDMMIAKDQGLDNAEPRTPAATTPTTFRLWCEDVLKPAVQGG